MVDATPVGMPGAEFSLTSPQGEAGGVTPEYPGLFLGLGPEAVIGGAPFQRATFLSPLRSVDVSSGVLVPAADSSATAVLSQQQ